MVVADLRFILIIFYAIQFLSEILFLRHFCFFFVVVVVVS